MALVEINKSKSDLREAMRIKRSALPSAERKFAATAIANSFMGNIPFNKGDKIALYWPTLGEVDIILLIDALCEQGYVCALPVIDGKDKPLLFREYKIGMTLQRSKNYSILEPPISSKLLTPTMIVVPLLAFDKLGNRLGYGGGFYDRTIESLRNNGDVFTVGVAYDFSQVSLVPSQTHDQKIDCVITDKRVVVCG